MASAKVGPEINLKPIAESTGRGYELAFFGRLRSLMQAQLSQAPEMVRVHGLRPSVKILLGARRWNERCQQLNDQILDYLRRCLLVEAPGARCTLVVREH